MGIYGRRIGTVQTTGDVSESVFVLSDKKGGLGSLEVGGSLVSSSLLVEGKIGKVQAGRVLDTLITSGLVFENGRPSAIPHFARSSRIASIRVTGGGPAPDFAGSTIVAYSIGNCSLGHLERNNGGEKFGLVAARFAGVSYIRNGDKVNWMRARGSLTDGDFRIATRRG